MVGRRRWGVEGTRRYKRRRKGKLVALGLVVRGGGDKRRRRRRGRKGREVHHGPILHLIRVVVLVVVLVRERVRVGLRLQWVGWIKLSRGEGGRVEKEGRGGGGWGRGADRVLLQILQDVEGELLPIVRPGLHQ